MNAARGRFVSLEGGEGAGKSTQLRLLADRLRAAGHQVVTTREPGGAPGAEQIRRLLVEGAVERWDPMTEALLHVAARRDHLVATVWPALASGAWVLSDRFADSTVAYQGFGHGLGAELMDSLHDLATDGFQPDLTLILDLPVEAGLTRAGHRGIGEDRYERMGHAFHERLRQGFLEIARRHPGRCEVVSALGEIEAVQARLAEVVARRLPGALA